LECDDANIGSGEYDDDDDDDDDDDKDDDDYTWVMLKD